MTATVASSADTTVELDTITLTAPDPDDEIVHVVCCDPDRALCGIDVSGTDWFTEWVDVADVVCWRCRRLAVRNTTCGARLCRLRTWARHYFGRQQ